MKNLCLIGISLFFAVNSHAQTGNESCLNPSPYCVGLTYTANAGVASANVIDPGNNYGCLFSQPNPSWFFLKAETAGTIDLNLFAPSDIDFIIYGPFSDINEMISLSGQLGVNPDAPEVDCSYSGTNSEYPSIPDMVVGDYYLLLVTNYASVTQDITIQQIGGAGSLDCAVFEEQFHHIAGTTFYDLNQNGSMDGGDFVLPDADISVSPTGVNLTTNMMGGFYYNYFTPDSIFYTVSASFDNWTSTTSDEIQFYLDSTNNDTTGLMFGFIPDSLYYSNELDLIGLASSCVLTNNFWLNVHNNGTLTNGGLLQLTLDTELTFVNADYPVDSISGNDIYFSFDTLLPFHSLSIQIAASPSPSLIVGDTITNLVDLVLTDSLLASQNTYTDSLLNIVVCSYDPNNKIALTNGNLSLDNILQPTDKLEYIINFQNTGNAAAVNVKIEDQLSALLDETTFEFLSSSHAVNVSIDAGNIILFDFPGINLPDSNSNEPLSHGYVKFSIGLDSGVLPNDVVDNTAAIYFDNNPPVITNTAENVLDCFIVPAPISMIYLNGQIFTNITDPSYTFTWLYEGNVIPGEVTNQINCTQEGVYTVVVSNEYGCQNMASYFYNSLGVTPADAIEAVIYPNPSDNNFGVRFAKNGDYQIQVLDESGRIILTEVITNSGMYTIAGSALTKGVYFVQISAETGSSAFYRIVKL